MGGAAVEIAEVFSDAGFAAALNFPFRAFGSPGSADGNHQVARDPRRIHYHCVRIQVFGTHLTSARRLSTRYAAGKPMHRAIRFF